MTTKAPYIDLTALSATEVFTLWLCLHSNASQHMVQEQIHDALADLDNAHKVFDRWRGDIHRQLSNKGMADDSTSRRKDEFADFLFCLLSKVPHIEQQFAKEILLVYQLEHSSDTSQFSHSALSSWFSNSLH